MFIEIFFFLEYDLYAGKIVNKTSLMCAIAAGNNELINLLLQYEADVNAMDELG